MLQQGGRGGGGWSTIPSLAFFWERGEEEKRLNHTFFFPEREISLVDGGGKGKRKRRGNRGSERAIYFLLFLNFYLFSRKRGKGGKRGEEKVETFFIYSPPRSLISLALGEKRKEVCFPLSLDRIFRSLRRGKGGREKGNALFFSGERRLVRRGRERGGKRENGTAYVATLIGDRPSRPICRGR